MVLLRLTLCALLLCCCLAPGSARNEVAGSKGDGATCATVKCAGGTRCVIRRGKPACVKPSCKPRCKAGKVCIFMDGKPRGVCVNERCKKPCGPGKVCKVVDGFAACVKDRKPVCNLACVKGKTCKIMGGKPKCVDRTNLCAVTLCPLGTLCQYQPGDKFARCITKCATVKCSAGHSCIITKEGNAQCALDDPCIATTCPVGTFCIYQAGDESAQCITNCATVKCSAGFACAIDKKGNASCAPENPCAATTCPVGTFCTFELGDHAGTCVTNCARVRCISGTTCSVNEKGDAQCVPNTRRRFY